MINAEKIRAMSNEQLGRFLFIWKVNTISEFFQNGFVRQMDAKDIRNWLSQDVSTFVCVETEVPEDMVFDQEFCLKEGNAP